MLSKNKANYLLFLFLYINIEYPISRELQNSNPSIKTVSFKNSMKIFF